MSTVVPARVDRRLIKKIDQMVSKGLYVSRSDAVRDAIRGLLSAHETEEPLRIVYRVIAQVAAAAIEQHLGKNLRDIVLFGSVSSGRATQDSDIDLLILIEGKEESKTTRDLVKRLYPIMLASDTVITPLVCSQDEFQRRLEEGYVFAREIARDGIQIYGDLLHEFRDRKTS